MKAKVITGTDQVKGKLYERGGIVADPYPGPYLVKPKDTAQTLPIQNKTATEDIVVEAVALQAKTVQPNESGQSVLPDPPNVGLSSVSVGEIPSTYVGSNVPRRTSSDVFSVGPNVTVPRGYYDQYVVHEVDEGSLPTPSISVNSTGLVTASVTQDQLHAGYIGNGKTASATQQLSTEAGKTVTPTESEQTAVAAEKFTTGDIKVGAISSTYVGSSIPQNDSTDLSVSGATVSVPSGYYAANASATIPNATWKSASTVASVPAISVDANGLITANSAGWTSCYPLNASGYADSSTAANLQLVGTNTSQLPTVAATTYTPSDTQQTIASGQYLTGAQTIEPIPPQYYDMSDPMSWLGKDVELINDKAYYREFTLDQTDFHGWTPSTSAKTCIASVTGGTFTATDMTDYAYYLAWENGVDLVYRPGTTNKTKPLFVRAFQLFGVSRLPTTWANIKAASFINNASFGLYNYNFMRLYGTTTDTLTQSYSSTYGFYFTSQAATFSSTTANSPTVTIKTPTFNAQCHNSYMSTTNAGLIDEENSRGFMRCRVYRVRKVGIQRGIHENLIPLINGDVEFSSLSPLKLSAPSPGWNGTLEYSYGGSTWATWDGSELENNIIRLRGTGNTTITGGGTTHRWKVSGTDVRVAGNIESLLDFGTVTDYGHPTMAAGAFLGLFSRGEAHILDASMLRFPDTVNSDCYREMFEACSTLVYAPSLPATIMQPDCYREMFRGCANLASAPALPAPALASGCYLGMFKDCFALTAVPSLKAPVLANNCYREMFMGCVDLKISTTQDTGYNYTFEVPTGVSGTDATDALTDMFLDPYGGIGSPVGTPTINTTYYATFQTV